MVPLIFHKLDIDVNVQFKFDPWIYIKNIIQTYLPGFLIFVLISMFFGTAPLNENTFKVIFYLTNIVVLVSVFTPSIYSRILKFQKDVYNLIRYNACFPINLSIIKNHIVIFKKTHDNKNK